MLSPIDDALQRICRQPVDLFEQCGLQRHPRVHEQMYFYRPPRGNLASFEGLHAIVAVEVQQLETIV